MYYLQLTKSITFYGIKYPSNIEVYLQEMRKLVDLEHLQLTEIVRWFDPDFDLIEYLYPSFEKDDKPELGQNPNQEIEKYENRDNSKKCKKHNKDGIAIKSEKIKDDD